MCLLVLLKGMTVGGISVGNKLGAMQNSVLIATEVSEYTELCVVDPICSEYGDPIDGHSSEGRQVMSRDDTEKTMGELLHLRPRHSPKP